MSVSLAQSAVESCRRELERHRDRQAKEEAKAARLEREAIRYEEQAARTTSPASRASHLRNAQSRRSDVARARDAAARESKAVADAQKRLHDAEARLAKEIAREDARAREAQRRDRERADRARREDERRARDRERERERQIEELRRRAEGFETRLHSTARPRVPAVIDVLFIAASPEDQPPLRLDKEVREIQQRVRTSEFRDAVRFHWRPASQVTDLLQALNEVRPHVVHFSGHGTQDALIFEDADGQAKQLTNSDLGQLLHISSDRIRLALFNSCDSADQAALACDHIDAAIGMDRPVDDHAAKVFAGQFYNALGFGKSLREAFEQAVLQVKLETGARSGEPKLHTAEGIDPRDIVLVRGPRAEEAA